VHPRAVVSWFKRPYGGGGIGPPTFAWAFRSRPTSDANRYWLLSRLLAWEAERAVRGRVAAFPRSFLPRKALEEAR
jgi:hypothetical protein